MALINQVIGPRGFEIVRDRLAVVLLTEIQNQIAEFDVEDIDVSKIWIERTEPFQQEELPAINISIDQLNFDSKHMGAKTGNYRYNIDVYTAAEHADDVDGDALASVRCWKLMGIVDSILENPVYKTLGLPAPFLMRSLVEAMQPLAVEQGDSMSTRFGRMIYTCSLSETTSLIVAHILEGAETTVKLGTSNLGYFFEYEAYSS